MLQKGPGRRYSNKRLTLGFMRVTDVGKSSFSIVVRSGVRMMAEKV